jgi:hypothetical protein
MTQLLVNIVGSANGAGDFFAQYLTISGAQPRKMTSQSVERYVKPPGNFLLVWQGDATAKKRG